MPATRPVQQPVPSPRMHQRPSSSDMNNHYSQASSSGRPLGNSTSTYEPTGRRQPSRNNLSAPPVPEPRQTSRSNLTMQSDGQPESQYMHHRSSASHFPPAVSPPSLALPTAAEVSDWLCDACQTNIPHTSNRVHCLVCPDLDLHETCYLSAKTPSNHYLSHDVQAIDLTHCLSTASLHEVSDSVNPHTTRGRQMRNIDSDPTSGERLVRLFNSAPKHIRFMVFDVPPGKYKAGTYFRFQISPHLSGAGAVKGTNLGKLRVCVGIPRDFRQFDEQVIPENDEMAQNLFDTGVIDYISLDVPAETPDDALYYDKLLQLGGRVEGGGTVYVNVGEDERLGVLIQWIGVLEFKQPNTDGAILDMILLSLR
ncbi:hypothetical protein BDD12DRAFT_845126 [Trichophaea hybrida]|nr:hypothetical protein BDD12DRAFT_845126 [Trichophaea hybrida]